MHHKSKQRRQKAWDDGVAPGVDLFLSKGFPNHLFWTAIIFASSCHPLNRGFFGGGGGGKCCGHSETNSQNLFSVAKVVRNLCFLRKRGSAYSDKRAI